VLTLTSVRASCLPHHGLIHPCRWAVHSIPSQCAAQTRHFFNGEEEAATAAKQQLSPSCSSPTTCTSRKKMPHTTITQYGRKAQTSTAHFSSLYRGHGTENSRVNMSRCGLFNSSSKGHSLSVLVNNGGPRDTLPRKEGSVSESVLECTFKAALDTRINTTLLAFILHLLLHLCQPLPTPNHPDFQVIFFLHPDGHNYLPALLRSSYFLQCPPATGQQQWICSEY